MPLRILVVDDDPNTLRAITRLLRSFDHSVEACESARVALARLAETAYDVLLTDFVMPESTGLELIANARRVCPSIRAVVMSGYPRVAGVDPELGWLSKPIDVDLLLTTLAG